jgi:AraC-like DNA-binding protein
MGMIIPSANPHFAMYPADLRHVKPLLHWFDVTYARRQRKGATEVAVYFLKPVSADVAGFLGLGRDRDVLYIYSPFSELQARALTILDEIHMTHKRLDKTLSLIASDDPRTPERVAQYLRENPERLPIVGLSAADLLRIRSATDLTSLFTARHFTRDLFSFESPLTEDALFFGREPLVSALSDRLALGQNTGLFGLRRIGKTSVLFALDRRMTANNLATTIYRDLSSSFTLRWWQLLEQITKDLASRLNMTKAARQNLASLNQGYTAETAGIAFHADVQQILKRASRGRVCLLLDEIHHIAFDASSADHWRDDYLTFSAVLRSLHQSSAGTFTYIMAGVNPSLLEKPEVQGHDNPLFSTVDIIWVPLFTKATTSEMINRVASLMGLTFQSEVIAALYADFGGHPYLTRRACSELAAKSPRRPSIIDGRAYEESRLVISRHMEKNCNQILNTLARFYPAEFELLRSLAEGDAETFLEFAQLDADFVDHVEGYGLVRHALTRPRLTIGAVGGALRKLESPHDKSGLDGSTDQVAVWAEVATRRNLIESRLRTRLAAALELSFGVAARAEVMKCIDERRRAALDSLSYEDLWDQLYFLELTRVLTKHYALLQKWLRIDRDKLVSWLDYINDHRIDAHARAIDSDSLTYLRACFTEVEERLGINR